MLRKTIPELSEYTEKWEAKQDAHLFACTQGAKKASYKP